MRFETTYDIPNEYLRLLFKGSFLFSSALLFFFFLLHHLLFWSSKEEHWKSLIKKIAPKFVWTWSHAYSAWMIWTPVTSHFQKDKLMSRVVHFSMIWAKTQVDLLFKTIDIGDFNNLRPVSTLLHISKLKERVVFAQPNFHSSSSGLHPASISKNIVKIKAFRKRYWYTDDHEWPIYRAIVVLDP